MPPDREKLPLSIKEWGGGASNSNTFVLHALTNKGAFVYEIIRQIKMLFFRVGEGSTKKV